MFAVPRARVLVVDDDHRVQQLVRHATDEELLDLEVAEDGRTALAIAQAFKPDIAIVDVRLPGHLDGFAVARQLQDLGDIAVLFLSAADSIEDRLAGFKAGADDYVVKPCFADELTARIRAILRRRGLSTSAVWRVGDLTVDEGTRGVSRCDHPIELTRTEFEILLILVRHRGRVVPREALTEEVWGYGPSGNVLEVHMSSLRRKLEAFGERCIHTVRSVGYVLRPPA